MNLLPCPICCKEKGELHWAMKLGGTGVVWWVECQPGNDKPGQCRFSDEPSPTADQAVVRWNNLERVKATVET